METFTLPIAKVEKNLAFPPAGETFCGCSSSLILLPFELLRFQSHPCSAQPLLLTEPGALFTALCGLCDRALQKPQPPPPLPRGSLSDAFALVLCFVFIMVLKGSILN